MMGRHNTKSSCGKKKGQFMKKSSNQWLGNVQALGQSNKLRKVRENVTVEPAEEHAPTRRRVVDVNHLGKELWCKKCDIPLSLNCIEGDEKQHGLAFESMVRCCKCKTLHVVETCKSRIVHKNRQFDVNSKLVLGAFDAGIGNTAVNTVLSALNIPTISTSLYRRHEQKVGPVVEEVAHEGCRENILIEKELTLRNRSCPEETAETNSVSLLVSTDGAWHKRASGRSYNSLSGHNSLIGHHSQRLIGFAVRSKLCKNFWCRKGCPSPKHKCRKNWSGSAKAMEPHMTVELTAKNADLEKENCYVGTLIGDDDSSSIAAVRRESENAVAKFSDLSHAKRSLSSSLYALRVDASLRQYLLKSFMLTIRRNKNKPDAVRGEMLNIVNHVYGDHQDCRKWGGTWCTYADDPANYIHKGLPNGAPLTKAELRGALTTIFQRFAKNAEKLAPCASSQANESFNNTVAAKNSKRQCYAGSESVFTRVAASAAQKIYGTGYITKCNVKLNLSPGLNTKKHRAQADAKRAKRSEDQKTVGYKRKRLHFQLQRSKTTDAAERREGVTYDTGCDMDGIAHLVDDPAVQVNIRVGEKVPLIYVDLETTGLSRLTAEVCQIGGKCGEEEFGAYIVPLKSIPPMVSHVTGLTVEAGQLLLNGDAVSTTPPRLAWANFLSFIKTQGQRVILVAHNGFRYDFPIILRCIKGYNLLGEFCQVVEGLADTLPIFKAELKDFKSYKQSSLAEHFKISNPLAHNAVGDVRVLHDLIAATKISQEVVLKMSKPVSWVISNEHRLAMKPTHVQSMDCLKPSVSVSMINKIASCGLSLQSLQAAFQCGGEKSVLMLLGEDVGGKPRVTKQKKNNSAHHSSCGEIPVVVKSAEKKDCLFLIFLYAFIFGVVRSRV